MYLNTARQQPKYTDITTGSWTRSGCIATLGIHAPEWADLNNDGNRTSCGQGRRDAQVLEVRRQHDPERKGSDMVLLENGSFRYFNDWAATRAGTQ